MKQKFFVSGIIASIVAIVYLLSFSKKESVQVTFDFQRPIQQRLLKRSVRRPIVQQQSHQLGKQPDQTKEKVVPPLVEPIIYPFSAASLITIPSSLTESASPFDFSDSTPEPAPKPIKEPISSNAAAAFSTAAAVRSRPRRLTGSVTSKPVLAKIPEVVPSRSFTSILDL